MLFSFSFKLLISLISSASKIVSLSNLIISISENDENENETQELINEDKNVHYENWILKKINPEKIKKYYLVLINKDIFYYQSNDKKNLIGMHNLSGCFIKEDNEKEIIDNNEYYSFEIIFKNKSKIRNFERKKMGVEKWVFW